ncbi:MAG TPA: hypothetical protein VLK34_04280 [Nocardioidaceae bacterium]|nr:hypothetical protein [Nocardioidaceae bacterium]
MEGSDSTSATIPGRVEGEPRYFRETRRWWGQIGRWKRATVGFLVVSTVIGGIWAFPHFLQWKYEQSYLSRTHIRMSDDEKLAVGYRACDWLRAQPASEFDPDAYGNGGIQAAETLYWRDSGEWWVVRFTARQAWLQLCRDVAIDKLGADPRSLFGGNGGD